MSQQQQSNLTSKFDNLEQTLEVFIENCRHLCVITADFQSNSGLLPPSAGSASSAIAAISGGNSNSQMLLNQKLQTFVQGLLELDQSKHLYKDVKIPLELLDYVDNGKNPQFYTKDIMESCLQKNNQTRGKIELYRKFRAHLLKELGEELPEEIKLYRMIRPLQEEPVSVPTTTGQGSNPGSIAGSQSDMAEK
uniref:Mediator of RNA polymerase II transcription subunit 10 n=1 Tax=Romanomermis culicivorax TaxID=13658 RepID=A0A915K9T8_ROMCU